MQQSSKANWTCRITLDLCQSCGPSTFCVEGSDHVSSKLSGQQIIFHCSFCRDTITPKLHKSSCLSRADCEQKNWPLWEVYVLSTGKNQWQKSNVYHWWANKSSCKHTKGFANHVALFWVAMFACMIFHVCLWSSMFVFDLQQTNPKLRNLQNPLAVFNLESFAGT